MNEDYRGELGVVLFNFGDEEFKINMGDKIAQLIFEKIKTPEVVEVDSLEETGRGETGFGSTRIKSEDQKHIRQSLDQKSDQSSDSAQDRKYVKKFKNEPISHVNIRSQASKTRQIITARQIQKLAKRGQLVYLAIVRPRNDVPRARRKRGGNKKSPVYAATAHGMTEDQKKKSAKKQAQRRNLLL